MCILVKQALRLFFVSVGLPKYHKTSFDYYKCGAVVSHDEVYEESSCNAWSVVNYRVRHPKCTAVRHELRRTTYGSKIYPYVMLYVPAVRQSGSPRRAWTTSTNVTRRYLLFPLSPWGSRGVRSHVLIDVTRQRHSSLSYVGHITDLHCMVFFQDK